MQIFNKKTVMTMMGLTSIFFAIGINSVLSASQQKTPPPKVLPQFPIVSVTAVSPITHQSAVTTFGEVKSRNQLTLTSQVSGQVVYLSSNFLSGKTFSKGEVLARIEPIIYEQALANANANLADAKLSLAEEELNSHQAAQEWSQSGLAKEQASDLALRKPQLEAAKAKYIMAIKEVEKAKYDLSQTELVAPFDALVVSKEVQVGTNVQVGASLADLYDISLFEISLPLTQQQWQLLPKQKNNAQQVSQMQVQLFDDVNSTQWTARVDRFEQHIDGASRQRSLIAVIEQPIKLTTPLFPGTFVKANIQGNTLKNLWKLPASALIDNDTVWQVNNKDLLEQLAVKVVFSENNAVYVQPLNHIEDTRIVNRPLSSYLANMKVAPNIEELL